MVSLAKGDRLSREEKDFSAEGVEVEVAVAVHVGSTMYVFVPEEVAEAVAVRVDDAVDVAVGEGVVVAVEGNMAELSEDAVRE